jgi:putative membrane protein insertion efficiency factor
MKNPLVPVVRGLILVYQKVLSPLKPPSCRFHPTCSEYFRQAVETHGLIRGSYAGIRRILRCHPFAPGGFDPVKGRPDAEEGPNHPPGHDEPGDRSGVSEAEDARGHPSPRRGSDRPPAPSR